MITERINKATPMSRDSVLLWVFVLGAALAYVQVNGNPAHWTFDQWVSAGIAGVAWLTGKLQNSPFPSAQTLARRKR